MTLTQTSLPHYFAERVEQAAAGQKLDLSRQALDYLVGLLARLAQADRLFPAREPVTLTELHLRASQAQLHEAARLYREIGDRALFISGWFSESLERRPVGVSYYTEMGGAAYHRTATLMDDRAPASWARLFSELAHRFGACVGLLTEVSEQETSDADVLRLYELWLCTRSPFIAQRLARLGVLPEEPGNA